jgi:uncharacterized NAD(P)/FAD-binding protein YdhS
MKIESTNDHLMVMAAVRYCLGRKSYIVSSCTDFLNEHWDKELQISDKRIILRDIAEYLQDWEKEVDSYGYIHWKHFGQDKYVSLPEVDQEFIREQLSHRKQLFPFYEQS